MGPPSASSQPGDEAATDWTGQPLAAGPADTARHSQEVRERWHRIVRAFKGIRRLQRIFHNTGKILQIYPMPLRDRISKFYPQQ